MLGLHRMLRRAVVALSICVGEGDEESNFLYFVIQGGRALLSCLSKFSFSVSVQSGCLRIVSSQVWGGGKGGALTWKVKSLWSDPREISW